MSSSASSEVSSGFRGRGSDRDKGIPRKCRCGKNSMIQTSETLKNPGRLFYCCPYGSKEDRSHLFKWTDISMVEELEEVESVVGKIQVDVGSLGKSVNDVQSEIFNLAMETRTYEAVANSYGNKIEAIKSIAEECEKEIRELKDMVSGCEKEIECLRCFKNMVICGLVMLIGYYFIFA